MTKWLFFSNFATHHQFFRPWQNTSLDFSVRISSVTNRLNNLDAPLLDTAESVLCHKIVQGLIGEQEKYNYAWSSKILADFSSFAVQINLTECVKIRTIVTDVTSAQRKFKVVLGKVDFSCDFSKKLQKIQLTRAKNCQCLCQTRVCSGRQPWRSGSAAWRV